MTDKEIEYQLREEMNLAAHGSMEVLDVQGFVLGMRVGIGILDAHQQSGYVAEHAGETAHEGNGAPTADQHRLPKEFLSRPADTLGRSYWHCV